MAAAPPGGRELPPPLPEELFEEVLLRLPPDDPACLLRASLVCKAWGCAVSRPGFRRSLHELHRTPTVLGFFHDLYEPRTPHFIPTPASPFSLDAPDWESWGGLDCHHGRALFLSKGRRTMELLVWEPITGFQRRVPVPPAYGSAELGSAMYPSAAVLCAADGCDHRDCLGGPFRVVFVFVIEEFREYLYATLACVYSSETGTWGEPTSMHHDLLTEFIHYSHALVGSSLLYFNFGCGWIVEYDIASQNMTVFDSPGYEWGTSERFHLVLTEDGGLAVSELLVPHFKLWTREASEGTDSQWVLRRVIDLENLLPDGAFADATRPVLVSGFAEGANVIFVVTPIGLFTIELRSEEVRKVSDERDFCSVVPVVSFYTPAPRGEHQSKPSEEAGREEGGDEVKTVDQAQQLFDKWFNAIKEGGPVNTFTSVRVAHDFKTSELNIHGCTLLPKAQEVINPSDDFSKSVPDEESVKGKSRKTDAGNSTSDSNVECAPPSEIGHSE